MLPKPHRRVRGWGNGGGEALKLLLRGQSLRAVLNRGGMEGAMWIAGGRASQAEGTAHAKALRQEGG